MGWGAAATAAGPHVLPCPPPDLRLINTQAIFAKRTGMIILGGGLVKHHIANANLMVSAGGPWGQGRAGVRRSQGGGAGPPGLLSTGSLQVADTCVCACASQGHGVTTVRVQSGCSLCWEIPAWNVPLA